MNVLIDTIEVSLVPIERKEVLWNIYQLYLYDLNPLDGSLVLDDYGRYGCVNFDKYWSDEGRYPYLLTANGRLAGFVLVRAVDDTFEIAEFFVMRRARGKGVGATMAARVFELHKGKWKLSTQVINEAQHFWRKVVAKASGGKYKEKLIYNDKRVEWTFEA